MDETPINMNTIARNNISSKLKNSTSEIGYCFFKLELPVGKYILLRQNQLNKTILKRYTTKKYIIVDFKCMKKWWHRGMASIQIIDKNIEHLDFFYPEKCFVPDEVPCIDFTGPMPP